MKTLHLLGSILIFIFFSCTEKLEKPALKYINAGNIEEQSFTINTDKDTTLKSNQGIQIKIDAGSIKASTNKVTVRLKEALSLNAILKAGLTTQTSNGILSSDGMFYIDTKEESSIQKPLHISLPTPSTDAEMQLYKGKEKNGKIIWEEPTKLETKIKDSINGKSLFMTYCSSCHKVNQKLIGPDLAWIENRWQYKNSLTNYILNSSTFLKSGDEGNVDTSRHIYNQRDVFYANCVYKNYGKVAKPAFTGILNDQQVDAIIGYINAESKRLEIPDTYNPNSYFDTCYKNVLTYFALLSKYDSLQHEMFGKGGQMTNTIVVEPKDANPNNDKGIIPTKVRPEKFYAEYYQFNITAYGWYNVDDLIQDKFNSKESELTVEVKEPKTEKFNIYLIIPSLKVFTEGGKLNNKKQYGFYTIDGKLSLPQGYKAYVFLLGEQNGELYFGKTEFITSLKQNITITQKNIKTEDVLNEISEMNAQNFGIKVSERKQYADFKLLQEELYNLEHKLEACRDCIEAFK